MTDLESLRIALNEASAEQKKAWARLQEARQKYRDEMRKQGLLFTVWSVDVHGNSDVSEFETRADAESWVRQLGNIEQEVERVVVSFTGPGLDDE